MPVRESVKAFTEFGGLPSEEAAIESIAEAQRLLELIEPPISAEEGQLLITAFGSDSCFGLAWKLLHLIETAPNALTADYSLNSDNEWVRLLEDRRRDA